MSTFKLVSLLLERLVHLPAEHSPCELRGKGFLQLWYTAVNAIHGFNAMCVLGKTPRTLEVQKWIYFFSVG